MSEFDWHDKAMAWLKAHPEANTEVKRREMFKAHPITTNEPMSGTYRDKDRAGNWRAWYIWRDSGTGRIRCRMNQTDITSDDTIIGRWPHLAKNPIPEEVYYLFVETGEWAPGYEPKANGNGQQDAAQADPAPQAEAKPAEEPSREVIGGNNPPPDEEKPIDEVHAEKIKTAIAAAPTEVKSLDDVAKATGSKNRIAELRLAADKDGKAIYEPLYRAYTAEQKKWPGMIKDAQAAEKRIETMIKKFHEDERQKAISAAMAEQARLAEEQANNERAADRAIARGEEPEAPVVEETAIFSPPIINPTVAPTYGARTVKAELKTFVENVTDWDALFAHYKNREEVQTLLRGLAQKDVANGITPPGITTREGFI